MPAANRALIASLVALATVGSGCLRATRAMPGTIQRQLLVGGATRTYLLHEGGEAKPRTRVALFGPCAAGTEVAFYTIDGGGHAWPGGESVRGLVSHGNTPRDFDAGEVIWDFFKKHPRR